MSSTRPLNRAFILDLPLRQRFISPLFKSSPPFLCSSPLFKSSITLYNGINVRPSTLSSHFQSVSSILNIFTRDYRFPPTQFTSSPGSSLFYILLCPPFFCHTNLVPLTRPTVSHTPYHHPTLFLTLSENSSLVSLL